MRQIDKAVEDWVNDGVIDQDSAKRILHYEKERVLPGNSTALVVFAILGALLVALGISLIVAQNWDDIPRNGRIVISFLPMILGQCLLGFAIFKRSESVAWREASSAFLLLTTGATLALISQVFQLQGTTADFLILWLICTAPIMFISGSSAAAMLFLILSAWFSILAYWQNVSPWHVLWTTALLLVFVYYRVINRENQRAVAIAFGTLIPAALAISLGHAFKEADLWIIIALMSLFQIYILFNGSRYFTKPSGWRSGFELIGFVGSVVMLFLMTKKFFVSDLATELKPERLGAVPSAWVMIVLLAAAYIFMLLKDSNKGHIMNYFFPFMMLGIVLSYLNVDAALLYNNLIVLLLAVYMISRGIKDKVLVRLNAGLVIFAILVIMRFFDYNLSFTVRGIAFLVIGALFFLTNKMALKNGKEANDAQ